MHPAAENSAESSIQLHVQIMLRKTLAAGSKIHSGFEEIELLVDRSVDFLNSAASRPDFSCTLIQNSDAEKTCSQQPKTAWNPRFSCMFRSCSAKFSLLDPRFGRSWFSGNRAADRWISRLSEFCSQQAEFLSHTDPDFMC